MCACVFFSNLYFKNSTTRVVDNSALSCLTECTCKKTYFPLKIAVLNSSRKHSHRKRAGVLIGDQNLVTPSFMFSATLNAWQPIDICQMSRMAS